MVPKVSTIIEMGQDSFCNRAQQLVLSVTLLLSLTTRLSAANQAAHKSADSDDICSSEQIDYSIGTFISGGKSIRVEQFRPKHGQKHPVIMLIHGSGGLLTRNGTELPHKENFGEIQLACAGYFSLLVHYFDRSGILSTSDVEFMEQQSPIWIETLREAVDYASSLPGADASRIGLFGESLGAYLALALAMHDNRIKAISEYGGGIRLRNGDDPSRLPPVFIQHGGADSIVPVEEALRLAAILSKRGIIHRLHIYKGLDHYLNSHARAEVQELSIQFFGEYLKPKENAPQW